MISRVLALFLSFVLTPLAAFAAGTAPLQVVVSIAPQKYMLERIAGDNVQVRVLVSPGADPHSYEPGPSAMRACADARAWFTIGIPFEDIWLDRIKKLSPDTAVISFIKDIKRVPYHFIESLGKPHAAHAGSRTDHNDEGHEHGARPEDADGHGHEHGGPDPHVWLSPMLVREMLPHLARELGKLMPDKAAQFRANARAFGDELEKIDAELAALFDPVPESRRVFLTFHPAWQYFALNYQLKELTIEVDGKEPGPQTMKAVIDTAKEHGITTIFIEPQFSRTAARAIAESIGAEVVETDPLAEDLPALYRGMAAKLVKSFPK